jgi:ATP-binding cassette subfamily F protein uup
VSGDTAKGSALPAAPSSKTRAATSARVEKKRRLTFKETSELAAVPDAIDALEREREAVYASLAEPALLRDGVATTAAKARLVAIESEIAARLARWEELESIAAG